MGELTRKLPAHIQKIYYPIDRREYVQRAIITVHPEAIVLVEAEIWPNFLWRARELRIPTFLVNARLSERSFRGYRRFGFLFQQIFGSFAGVGCQNETDAERLRKLGCRPEACLEEADRASRRTQIARDACRPVEIQQRKRGTRVADDVPARSATVLAREASIIDRFRSLGHPFAKAVSRDPVVDDAAHVMDVTFIVDPGPIARIGEVAVRGTQGIDPAVVRSFIYTKPSDPYSPKALSDMRRSIAKVESLGSVRVREGEALDADGNLPIFADVTDRERNLIGGAARYSTIDGPGIRAYYANRNLFGGGETLRIDGDLYYLGNDLYAAQRKLAGIDSNGLGGRLSGTFVKPALWGTRNDLVANVFASREAQQSYVSDAAGGTLAIRHRFSDTFFAQLGVEGQVGRSQDRNLSRRRIQHQDCHEGKRGPRDQRAEGRYRLRTP